MKKNIVLAVLLICSIARVLFCSNNEFECGENSNYGQRQECLYGDSFYSPDNPLIRDLINIDLINQKTVRVNFYSFANNSNTPFWNESDYLYVMEDLNTSFQDSKINFVGTYNFVNDEELLICYENDFQEESCQELPQCAFDRWNQLCYFDRHWIANEYNQNDDSIYAFVGRYKMSYGPTPWNDQSIANNRSVFLTQSSYNHNSKTVIHEFGHKFGLLHTFNGTFFNNGDCNTENSCWSIPNFDDAEFCDSMIIDECTLHINSCYWDENINYCKHIGNITGDLCSDTYPVPPPHISSQCIFPEAECNEIVYDYGIEQYNYNFMEYGYGCNEYHFTDQQIQRMHGWIEYNYEFQPNMSSNLCNFLEDYDCILFGCTDSFACNYIPEIMIDNGSCEYEAGSTSCLILGDINGDETLNILDIVLMINMIFDSEYSFVADVSGDGFVNILDVVIMVNILVGSLP